MIGPIQQLLDQSWEAIEARRDVIGGRQVKQPGFLPLTKARRESRFGDDFGALQHLDAALQLARQHELKHLADGLHAVRAQIRWSQNPSYDETNVSQELLDGYAYVGLSGPDSPVKCEQPLAGFLVMAPNVHYPDHRHAPAEIYLALTPGSQWSLDSGEWFDVAPGDLIFHDSWQNHATRSFAQPFLAFVAWLEAGDRSHIEI